MSTIKVKRTTGSSTPTGLTFGEPAYVQGLKSLYIGQTGGDPAIRIGAEVSTDATFASASDNKIPSQLAVKTYVDSNVAGGSVSTLNGLTGAIFIGAGTAISVEAAGKGITLTNTGVQSAAAGSGISVSGSTGAVTISNTGVTGLVAGTAISVSSATGNITVTNTGVQSIAGTTNQITASGSTGAVTLSLPSAITTPGSLTTTGDLTVGGNLTVNGNTTTVNSNITVVDDPIFLIGTSGGVPITVSDAGKDRGIAFTYFDSVGKTGFFGYDASSGFFTFIPDATIASEIVSGTRGTVEVNKVQSASGTNLVLQGSNATNSASVTIAGAATTTATTTTVGSHILSVVTPDLTSPGYIQIIEPQNAFIAKFTVSAALSDNRGYTFPNHSGSVVVPSDLGTSGFILKANGVSAQPTWINPNAAGFTAFTSTNVITTSDAADTTAFLAFINAGTDSNQGIKYNTGLTYNAVTNSLSATTFVGALSGNATTATTATNATNVATTADTADTLAFLTFVNLASDANQAIKYNSGLTYNASTNALSATTFIGALSGNATTATTLQTARNIGITGDINGTATSFNGSADINISAQIAADTIVNADINSAAGIVDTKLATISTANKVSLTALDIDGGTVTTTIVGSDLLIVDDGANGTNRYVTVDNLFGTNSTATVDGGSY